MVVYYVGMKKAYPFNESKCIKQTMNNKPILKKPRHPIVLASASVYKKQLLERLQIEFTTHAPDIDETIEANENPRIAALRLAKQKANTLDKYYQQSNTLIIGCDQVAFINDGQTEPYLGKPGTRENAFVQLKRSSGNTITFYTAFYVHQTLINKSTSHIDVTKAKYRTLSDAEINDYLDRENALDCAGSCKIEGLGISLLEEVVSKDPSALIGLPLITLNAALNKFSL